MKKTLFGILSMILLATLMLSAIPASATSAVTQYGEAKALGSPAPVIDGKIDEIWGEANTYYIEVVKVGTDTGIRGHFKILWTSTTLYVLGVIPDLTPNHEATDDYKKDTLEVALDFSNARTTAYENDDQMNLRFYGSGDDMLVAKTGNDTVTSNEIIWGFTHDAATGYIYEFAVECDKLGIALSADKVIGFDMQINDNAEGLGERAASYAWNDDADGVFNDPTFMGEIKLIAETANIAVVEEVVAAVDVAEPTTVAAVTSVAPVVSSAPQTSDSIVFLTLSAFLMVLVFIGVKKIGKVSR